MDSKVAGIWTTALRSGEYDQTQGTLQDATTGQCCGLGVLCMEAVKAGIIPAPVIDEDGRVMFGDKEDTSSCALPTAVVEWAGLFNSVAEFVGGPFECQAVVTLNDAYGYDFQEIANILDKNHHHL